MGASAPHTSMGRGGLIGTALAGHGTPHIYGAGASMGKRLGVSAPHTSMGRGPLWGSIGGSHRPTPPCTTTKPRPIGTVPPAGPAAPLPAQAPPLPVPAADAPRARRRPAMAAGSAARGAALRGAGGAVRGGSGAAAVGRGLRLRRILLPHRPGGGAGGSRALPFPVGVGSLPVSVCGEGRWWWWGGGASGRGGTNEWAVWDRALPVWGAGTSGWTGGRIVAEES